MSDLALPDWKRAVIKVGSALIAPDGQGCRTQHLLPIARFVAESMRSGKEPILVSSGAVAAGLPRGRPSRGRRSIPEKQALAALGQPLLMQTWSRLFDVPCAQMLLTHDDIRNRKRFVNAKNTFRELLKMGVLPIINENDSVAVEELKVGDNDNLAAHVAVLAEAELLIILSDIDGLYTANPRTDPQARKIRLVEQIDARILALAEDTLNPLATGGMTTKLTAAEKATTRGIDAVIANGSDGSALDALQRGYCPGTLFCKTATPLAAKKHWLRHALPVRGRLTIDKGATGAICVKGASLLPSGIAAVEGEFQRGDAVEIIAPGDARPTRLGKGVVQYDARQLRLIQGCHSREIIEILGFFYADVVVHREDLVLDDQFARSKPTSKNNDPN